MRAQLSESRRGRATPTTNRAKQDIADAPSTAQGAGDEQREQIIRATAYALFEARGCVYGHDLEDWLKAEAMVQTTTQDGAKPGAPAPEGH